MPLWIHNNKIVTKNGIPLICDECPCTCCCGYLPEGVSNVPVYMEIETIDIPGLDGTYILAPYGDCSFAWGAYDEPPYDGIKAHIQFEPGSNTCVIQAGGVCGNYFATAITIPAEINCCDITDLVGDDIMGSGGSVKITINCL